MELTHAGSSVPSLSLSADFESESAVSEFEVSALLHAQTLIASAQMRPSCFKQLIMIFVSFGSLAIVRTHLKDSKSSGLFPVK
jgi:hypothetical protein